MADDSEFITSFMRLGLSEKEAQVYLHLRRYGPEPLSLLATLKNHEEDIYRTLNGLIDKGLVNPSLETPTVYTAVELDVALDVMVTKYETEIREMERRKLELQDLSKQRHFKPSDEFYTFKLISNLKELISLAMPALATTLKKWVIICPAIFLVISSLYTIEDEKKFIDRGGKIEVITDFSSPYIETVRQLLDIGVDVRQLTGYRGIMFSVFDEKVSVSGINVDINRMSLDTSMSMIWTDDPTYAAYLNANFEMLWEQAVPAAERIEELLKEGAPDV